MRSNNPFNFHFFLSNQSHIPRIEDVLKFPLSWLGKVVIVILASWLNSCLKGENNILPYDMDHEFSLFQSLSPNFVYSNRWIDTFLKGKRLIIFPYQWTSSLHFWKCSTEFCLLSWWNLKAKPQEIEGIIRGAFEIPHGSHVFTFEVFV